MLLSIKIKTSLVILLLILTTTFVHSQKYQQTCTAAEIKDALRKALFEYFESPTTSKLSVNEIKDFLHFYISTDSSQLVVDCGGSGPLSGKPYYLMLGAARNIQRGIPACSDGTEYGKCSLNVPNYCYGGKLEERCKICGCQSGKACSSTGTCVGEGVKPVESQICDRDVRITTNSADQRTPAIYGDKIVWTDYRNGVDKPYIYMYNLAAGKETQIAQGVSPAIYKDNIVWTDYRDTKNYTGYNFYGRGDIYMYDITTGKETPISTVIGSQLAPHIYENKIVWYDYRDSNSDTDIYMYDITTGKETKIGGSMGNDHSPRIHGDRIIWNVYNDKTRDYDLYLYEISTGRQNQITKGQNMEVMADIYGDKIVWVTQYEDRTNEFPVYLYDINTKTQSRITSHSSTNFFPKIHGNRVVWMDYRSYSNSNPDIYMYDITTGKETQITTNVLSQGTPAIHDNKIVWEDNRNGNYDIYMATLSDAATGKCIPVSESSTSEQGTLVLAITDEIVEGIRELWVTLSNVEIHKDNQWVSFAPEQKTFELLSLADAAGIIGSKQLTPGKYTQIRFQVSSANLKLADGTTSSVKIPSGEIKLVQEFTIEEGKTTYLYIDFKPESVVKAGSQYILQPVIRLRTKDEFKGDLCENKNKCNDRNPCTTDSCSESFCSYEVLPDGTSCGNKKTCMSGNCVPEKNCKGGQCNVPDNWDPCAKINFNTTGYKISPPSPGYLYNFIFADLDGDGDKDIAAGGLDKKLQEEAIKIWRESGYSSDALNVSANVVRVYFNDGKGNFAYSDQYIGVPYIYPDLGDIDGDGDKDIVTGSTSWFKNAYNIYFNDGKGFFTPSSQRVGGYSNYQPKLADLDKDGDLDLYFASSISPLNTTGSAFLNDGRGYFTEKFGTGLVPGNTHGAALFDSDKDGDTDLVEFGYIIDSTGYYRNLTEKIYKNDGTGKFTLTQTIIDIAFAGGIASADVDNDGAIDFVAANGVFKNDGNGFFNRVSPEYGGSTYFDSPFGDADKDGDVDITAGHNIGANDGTGNFYGYCNWLEIGLYSIDAKFADADGDGDLDAATTSYDYFYNYTTGFYTITGSSLYIFPNLIK